MSFPSIFLHLSKSFPAVIGQQAQYMLDRSPIYHRFHAHTHTCVQFCQGPMQAQGEHAQSTPNVLFNKRNIDPVLKYMCIQHVKYEVGPPLGVTQAATRLCIDSTSVQIRCWGIALRSWMSALQLCNITDCSCLWSRHCPASTVTGWSSSSPPKTIRW